VTPLDQHDAREAHERGGELRQSVERIVQVSGAVAGPVLDPHRALAVLDLQGAGRVDAGDLAVDHERDPVAQLVGGGHVVRGQEDGRAALTLGSDQILDALCAGRVEPARRLVEEDQVRFVQQAAGDAQPALHSLRVVPDEPVAVALEPDCRQQPSRIACRLAIQRREVAQVLQARELREVVGRLEGHADPLVVVGGPVEDFLLTDAHAATIALEQADEDLLRRGLARTAGSEEAEDLAAADGERHSSHGRSRRPGIAEVEIADVDHALGRLSGVDGFGRWQNAEPYHTGSNGCVRVESRASAATADEPAQTSRRTSASDFRPMSGTRASLAG
jgi:hypothetical protein